MEKPKKRGRKSNAEKMKEAKKSGKRLPPPESISEDIKNATLEESNNRIDEVLKLYKERGGMVIVCVPEEKTSKDDKRIPEGHHSHAEAVVNVRKTNSMFVINTLKAVTKNLLGRMPPAMRMIAIMEILSGVE
jgi:hypothetical protein